MENLRPWQRALTALAYLKVLIGVGLYVAAFAHPEQPTPRQFLMATHVVAYGMAAVVLMVVGRRDLRATVLGVAFLLTAAVFADNAPQALDISSAPIRVIIGMVFALQVDAFTATFLWLFVMEFPRVPRFGPRYELPRLVMRWSLGIGVVLFSLNVAYFAVTLVGNSSPLNAVFLLFARGNKQGLYWPVQYAFSLVAFGTMIWKARGAPITERRRVSLLTAGLVAGTYPTVLYVILTSVWPGFAVVVPLKYVGWVLYPTLLSTPFTTAYAVLVHQALNARLVIRRALQYAFARYSVLGVVALPAFGLLGLVYRQRDRSLIELLAGRNGLLFAALILVAFAAWRGGRNLVERLDRRFFREQYNARHILGKLVERCQGASTQLELAESLRLELDRALHPVGAGVLFLRQDREYMSSPTDDVRPLPASSVLAQALDQSGPVIEIDLERGAGFVRSLPTEDHYWLADAGVRLLLPLRHGPGSVVGLIWLGEKRSELPYSGEDRQLLSTVSAAAALSVRSLGVQLEPQAPVAAAFAAPNEAAHECVACGLLSAWADVVCARCGSATVRASVPRVIGGKFRLDERIGQGGAGVVYLGMDLTLERKVAIKTLPRVAPDRAVRLRREARAMAAITHPNLALIYGSESWNGLPVLVVEYLAGGTLARRLDNGPIRLEEALDLAIALTEVTRALHRAGVLHRDIKPGNIGFTADGVPKLLDFGQAHLLIGVAQELADDQASGRIMGTPAYLSPEAVRGLHPEPSIDLWSICIVLFESITGTNPAQDVTLGATLHRIETGTLPTLDTFIRDAHPELTAFFSRAFSREASARPQSASALREQLTSLRAGLPSSVREAQQGSGAAS